MAAKAKLKREEPVSRLLQAMNLLSLCQGTKGKEYETHCVLSNYTAVAFDGVIALGQHIQENLHACPQTVMLALALARCDDQFAITQLSPDKLMVRSGEFQAYVPCCDRERLPNVAPDAMVAPLASDFLGALKIVAPLVSEKAIKLLASCIQLNHGSVIATNNSVVIEAWHGFDLPTILIPKVAATVLIKSKKNLIGFGCSADTATFWFDDDSWMRTQLYKDRIPDIASVLNVPSEPRSVSPAFFDAVKKIMPFSKGRIYCGINCVSSHSPYAKDEGGHLTIEVDGPRNRIYDAESLAIVAKHATAIDENVSQNSTLFYGVGLRGAIWHEQLVQPNLLTNTPCTTPNCDGTCDVCIPF